jgi:predicted nicotinamide N-methyase
MEEDAEEQLEYEEEHFEIGPYGFFIRCISFLPIELLLQLERSREEISGRRVWAGSLVLCAYMLENPQEIAGHAVVELGAGTGIAGFLAEKLGARRVCCTDHDVRCLELLGYNVSTNRSEVVVERVNWFDESPAAIVQSAIGELPTRLIAADVLYKRGLLVPFFRTCRRLLEPGGKLLLCHIPRAGVHHTHVLLAAADTGGLGVSDVTPSTLATCEFLDKYAEAHDVAEAKVFSIAFVAQGVYRDLRC